MKVRLQSGSLRFRLRQSEAGRLAAEGALSETLALGGGDFALCLRTHEAAASAELAGAKLTAFIPVGDVRRWLTGSEVGLYYTLPGGTRLLVEKDWACLEPVPGESNVDTFPRPSPANPAACRPNTAG